MFKKLKWWWFRRRNDVPHPEELYTIKTKLPHFRLVASLYAKGHSLEYIANFISKMDPIDPLPERRNAAGYTLPRGNMGYLGMRLFYGRPQTRERIRQMVWKMWRDNRVDHNVR
jgi:hypothetical protein